ncbi:mucin-2-like [Rhinichthys klamathensis goyatoka]|uniref:mucin-2-like n=1 Tax=Rhinichthys klamathensis goyatoka TaxID=3034132 RepID=UPI0024B549BA|nr:mucin-2-like [Rhinichthys klamathensis goyatoka]
MTVPWSLLWILGLICSSDSSCSPTSYYKSCWIRRYPGLYVDVEESQRRGAHILRVYQDESALKCSRACCLTPNFSCNLAVFHFNTTQDSVNCFHLQCPTAESCIPHRRGNVILYNVTKGVDPDLLVFGKHFTTNVRVLPHMSSSRLNVSEPLTSDKRQFNYPPVRSISPPSTSTKKPTTPQKTTRAVPTTLEVQHNLPRCATTTPSTSEHIISTTSLNPQQTSTTPQWESTKLHHITQTTSQTNEPDTSTDTLNHSIPNPSTTAHPSSTTDYFDSTLTSIPINEALTTQQPLGLQTTSLQTTKSLVTASQNPTQSFAKTTSLPNSDEYLETVKTVTSQSSASSQSETLTNAKPLTSANVPLQTQTQITPAYETIQAVTAQSTSEHVISTTSQLKMDSTLNPQQTTTTPQWTTTKPLTSANVPFQTSSQITPTYETIQATTAQSKSEHVISTTSQLKMDSTLNPQQMSTTPQWTTTKPLTSANVPFQTSSQITPANETSTPTQTTIQSQPKLTISSDTRTTNPTIPTDDSTTPRHLTLTFTHTRMGKSANNLSSSPTSSMMDSQPYPNDTKGYISRNITTGDVPRPVGDGGSLTSVWHLAANTVLVALATCATVTFCCCCSVFAALSWRGRRRRKGRYRTNLRGKRGSMRLIKYVIVRESS